MAEQRPLLRPVNEAPDDEDFGGDAAFSSRLSRDSVPPSRAEVAFASRSAAGGGAPLSWSAAACVVKCVVGGGSFYLPYGVMNAGVLGGTLGLILFGVLTGWLAIVVLRAKRVIHPVEPVGLDDVAGHLFGKTMMYLTTLAMVLAGVGGCAVYIQTLSDLLQHLLPGPPCALWLKLGITGVEILIASLPSFKLVAYTAIIGDVCLAVALTATIAGTAVMAGGDDGSNTAFGEHSVQDMPWFSQSGPAWFVVNQETLPSFFASAAFLFAVPSLLFPIENALDDPRQWKRSASTAFSAVTVLNSVFAVTAYVLVGSDTQPFIVSSLPKNLWWTTMIRIALLFDLLFTYNLTLVPSREIVEVWILGQTQSQEVSAQLHASTMRRDGGNLIHDSIHDDFDSGMQLLTPVPYWKRIITRVGLNVFCCGLAVLVPDISDLIAVGTSMALSWMTFIVGPLIVARVKLLLWRGRGRSQALKCSQISYLGFLGFLVIFGAVAGVATTYLSIVNVVNDFSHAKYAMCGLER
jgi:amino acid permease